MLMDEIEVGVASGALTTSIVLFDSCPK